MTRWTWIPLVASLVAPGTGPLYAQEGRKEVAEGNRLYDEGRYGEAHERYVEALRRAPGTPLIRFNEGNALYRSQEYERALEAFQDVATGESRDLNADAWYNLGNTFVRQQQLPQALEAYKQALRRDPGDVDAKHNLEVVLDLMDQQQDEQQQQDDPEQNEDPQDQNEGGGSSGGDSGDQNPDDGSEGGGRPEGQGEDPADPRDGEGEGSEGGQQPLPPGQMSREEAERLLGAVEEDPGEVERHAGDPRGRRPRKDW